VIFVDTGAWFARYVASDVDHAAAVAWFANPPDRLATTDYVVNELLTLLKQRGFPDIAFAVGATFIEGVACHLEYVSPTDIARAWVTFSTYQDKGWSFTDCASRAVMERLKIATVFTFDHHFREFGNVNVVP
jgi:predicted nucleic acid-binding protein